jgi:hypothetical protein
MYIFSRTFVWVEPEQYEAGGGGHDIVCSSESCPKIISHLNIIDSGSFT